MSCYVCIVNIAVLYIYIYDIWFQVTDDRLVSNSNLFKLQVNQPADWSPEDLEKLEQVASSMPQHATACRSMTASIQLPYSFHFHCEKMTLFFPSGACFHSSTINFIKFPWAGFTIFKADMHDSAWCLWMFHLSEQVWCQISSASGLCRVRHRLATGCKPCRWLQSWGVRRAMEALERPGTTHIGGSHWPSSVGGVGEPWRASRISKRGTWNILTLSRCEIP